MDLKNKIVCFLGDSITEGIGTTSLEYGFVNIISNELKLKDALNYGVSGTRIAKNHYPIKDRTLYDYNFLSRAKVMYKNADFVVVFGGTNDFGHGDAEIGDINSDSDYTFYGALKNLLKYLKEVYKENVIFFTPIRRKDENNTSKNKYGKVYNIPLKKYVDIIKEVCKLSDVKCIDLYNDDKEELIDLYNNGLNDDVHPNDYGNKILSKIIIEEINKYEIHR